MISGRLNNVGKFYSAPFSEIWGIIWIQIRAFPKICNAEDTSKRFLKLLFSDRCLIKEKKCEVKELRFSMKIRLLSSQVCNLTFLKEL